MIHIESNQCERQIHVMNITVGFLLFVIQGVAFSQETRTFYFDGDKELLRSHHFLNSLTVACLERNLHCQRHVKSNVFFTRNPIETNEFDFYSENVFDLVLGKKLTSASIENVTIPIHYITRYYVDNCEFIVS